MNNMRRIALFAILLAFSATVFAQEPEKGDIGAVVLSNFKDKDDAMRFVVQELLFPLDIVPEVYDNDLGYIVTERFYYQGGLNCQLVFFFKASYDGVSVKITGRDYNTNRGVGLHSGPMSYAKGMRGSPVEAYWNLLTGLAQKIPHKSLEYYSK